MRTIVILLGFLWLTLVAGGPRESSAACADPSEQILKDFFKDLALNTVQAEFYHLKALTKKLDELRPPSKFNDPDNRIWLTRVTATSPQARATLAKALVLAHLATPAPQQFRPDYCIVRDLKHQPIKVLWIDSDPAELQVQLWIYDPSTGTGSGVATFGIGKPEYADNVRDALRTLVGIGAIDEFLTRMTTERSSFEFYHRDASPPSANPPNPGDGANIPGDRQRDWPSRLTNNSCSDQARARLANTLAVAPPTSTNDFLPDYCIVDRQPQGQTRMLWIDSEPSRLQMQLWVTGNRTTQPGPVGISGIEDPTHVGVRNGLKNFVRIAEKPFDEITQMIVTVRDKHLPFDVLSVDPKQAEDVLKQKHWSVLGKVSPKVDDRDWEDVDNAIYFALLKEAAPAYTAQDFRPRLAVSTQIPIIPNGPRQHYLLLLSFEGRLAELYVDDKLEGCCGINNTGADQFLNNILVAAGKPLKPKTASSGN